jgi:hypothetical protein
MSQSGQTRRFGPEPVTSGLPQSTDIAKAKPHRIGAHVEYDWNFLRSCICSNRGGRIG